jgi:hypothetical protein
MQRLTPEQFYEQKNYRKLDKYGKRAAKFSYWDMLDFAQAYAEHLEQAAWVVDGTLPPVDPEDSEFSQNVLAVYELGNEAIAYVQLRTGNWYNARSHDKIEKPIKWRHLPTPPKQ